MIRRSPIFRIAVGLALLTLTVMLAADAIFSFSTDTARPQLAARKQLAETLAVQYSDLASRKDLASMRSAMELLVQRNPEVLSTAVRRYDDVVLAEAGDHRRHWRGAPVEDSTPTHARVPIFDGDDRWGTLEVRFVPLAGEGTFGFVHSTWFRVLAFTVFIGFFGYFFYMKRTLRHLDPTAVIPARVKAAFDVLAEGVAFVDTDGCIVLANAAFCRVVGMEAEQLMGRTFDSLGWRAEDETPPWEASVRGGEPVSDRPVTLGSGRAGTRDFVVNAAPIFDDARRARGVIVTFDDVTELERKKRELEGVVDELSRSRDEIQRQNEKLELMATRDALTNLLNRRAFTALLEEEAARAARDGTPLSCVMLDIDHFKSVNDTFGHVVGDAVIRFVAGIVSETTRGFDIVCRYGGEEFCVLLPAADLDTAFEVSERIRCAVETKSASALPEIGDRNVTVSLGVAGWSAALEQPMKLVDRADEALYTSKNRGRNRTTVPAGTRSAQASVA